MNIKKYLKRLIEEEDGFLPVLGALAGLAGGIGSVAGLTPAVAGGLGAIGGGLSALGSATQSRGGGQPQRSPQQLQRTTRGNATFDLNQLNQLQKLSTITQSMQAMRDPNIPQDVRTQYSEPLMGAYMKLKSELSKYSIPNMEGMK